MVARWASENSRSFRTLRTDTRSEYNRIASDQPKQKVTFVVLDIVWKIHITYNALWLEFWTIASGHSYTFAEEGTRLRSNKQYFYWRYFDRSLRPWKHLSSAFDIVCKKIIHEIFYMGGDQTQKKNPGGRPKMKFRLCQLKNVKFTLNFEIPRQDSSPCPQPWIHECRDSRFGSKRQCHCCLLVCL